MLHAHYNELDAIYAFNSQPSQCLYYVIIRIIGAGVSLFKILLLITNRLRMICTSNESKGSNILGTYIIETS